MIGWIWWWIWWLLERNRRWRLSNRFTQGSFTMFHLLFQPRSMLKWESAHPLRGFERWGMSPKKSRGSKSEEWRLLEPTDLRLFLEALTKTILKWGLVRSCEVSIDVWSERLGEFSSIFDGRVVLWSTQVLTKLGEAVWIYSGWWFEPSPLKNDGVRQLGVWHSQYMEK